MALPKFGTRSVEDFVYQATVFVDSARALDEAGSLVHLFNTGLICEDEAVNRMTLFFLRGSSYMHDFGCVDAKAAYDCIYEVISDFMLGQIMALTY